MGTYQECLSIYPCKATFKQFWCAPNPWPGALSTLFRPGDLVYVISTYIDSLGYEIARIDATGRRYRRWDDPLHAVPLDLLDVEEKS